MPAEAPDRGVRVLGLHGAFYGPADPVTSWSGHDAAAVLVVDGAVVAAVEEERLSRVKHANWFPAAAATACVEQAGLAMADIDRFAFPWQEATVDAATRPRSGTAVLEELVSRRLGVDARGRIRFCAHHLAHALSAVMPSGLGDCLVAVFDGSGDDRSGAVYEVRSGRLEERAAFTVAQSLGDLYTAAIEAIGLARFEEYKAMGLAPYGEVAGDVVDLSACLVPQDDGDYRLDVEPLRRLVAGRAAIRSPGAPFSRWDRAFAAGLQRLLVDAVGHVLDHHRRATGLRDLCLAGGVIHNCSLNGRLARSGDWDRIFVQPAAHDAGAALGAALAVCGAEGGLSGLRPLRTMALGRDVGGAAAVGERLARWSPWVTVERVDDPAVAAAEALAADEIIGWVQGRSEFGPRALGRRSILADPRAAANRDRVNQRIKRREAFRPFAPAVAADRAADWFEPLGAEADTDFMNFVHLVREDRRGQLGAVTHVDGSARVQTVTAEHDPGFAALLDAFEARTGVPVVLNTSFNGAAEPIVDSVDDAVAGLLTLGLDRLVIGPFVARARAGVDRPGSLVGLCPSLPFHRSVQGDRLVTTVGAFFDQHDEAVSASVATVLARADGDTPLSALLVGRDDHGQTLAALADLWRRKIINLEPSSRA